MECMFPTLNSYLEKIIQLYNFPKTMKQFTYLPQPWRIGGCKNYKEALILALKPNLHFLFGGRYSHSNRTVHLDSRSDGRGRCGRGAECYPFEQARVSCSPSFRFAAARLHRQPGDLVKMPAGHGLRSRTRDLFSRAFRHKGYIPLTVYLRNFKIGQYVDIKVNGAIHKGMPHKFYHGRTGIVWNVTKRAVGVVMNKQVRVHPNLHWHF